MLKRTDVGFQMMPEDLKRPGMVGFVAGITVRTDCRVETAFYKDPVRVVEEAKEQAKRHILHHIYGDASLKAREALHFIRKSLYMKSPDRGVYESEIKIIEDLLLPIINAERGE